MTTMLAAILTYNPLLVYNSGLQLSVTAVFRILFFRKPLNTPVDCTLLMPFEKLPEQISNLLSISRPRSRQPSNHGGFR